MRAATVTRWGSRPVRTWPIAAVKQSWSEVEPSTAWPPQRHPRACRRRSHTRNAASAAPTSPGGEGGDVDVGGVGAQAPAQPSLEPVEPRCAARRGSGPRAWGEASPAAASTPIRSRRSPSPGSVTTASALSSTSSSTGRASSRAADRGEELGDAGGEHRLDRGEVVEEGAARDAGPVGHRLGREALEAGVAHDARRRPGRGRCGSRRACGCAASTRRWTSRVARFTRPTVRRTARQCNSARGCTPNLRQPGHETLSPWSSARHRSRAKRRWCAAFASPSSARTT